MKKLLNVTLIAVALFYCAACSNLQSNAGKSLSSVAVAVDATMKAWASYVTIQNVPAEKQAQVRTMYAQYQTYMALAVQAYLALDKSNQTTVDHYNSAYDQLTGLRDGLSKTTSNIKLGIQ